MVLKIKRNNESKKNIWVLIPAFNEETTVGGVIDSIIRKGYSVLVIDDASTDNTFKIALNYPVVLLKHVVNLGQGAALQTGFNYLLSANKVKYVVTFDADGQHESEDIAALISPLETGKYDIVLGSRFLRKGDVKNLPFTRKIILKLAVHFTRISTRMKATDTHNGLRAFTIDALRKIRITQNRMAHASEILAQIASQKIRYCEVPVTVRYTPYSRKKGQNIFDTINIMWDLFLER